MPAPAMASTVEARSSLTSLNYLAANPPQYPHNPTEEKQEPLTLYISRVPGSRDVILSTSKPQLKNVTSHDVANSLYYVHLELPEENILPPPSRDGDSPRKSDESDRSTQSRIPRKPLPTGSKLAPSTHSTSPRQSIDSGRPNSRAQGPPPPEFQQQVQVQPQQQQQQQQLHQQQSSLPAAPPYSQQQQNQLQRTPPQQHLRPQRPRPLSAEPMRWSGDGKTFYSVESPPDLPGNYSPRRPRGPRPLSQQSIPFDEAGFPPQLPPRPTDGQRFTAYNPSRGHQPQTQPQPQPQPQPLPQLQLRSRSPQPPPQPPRPQTQPQTDSIAPRALHTRAHSRSPSPIRFHNTTAVPYILHLIRRDPTTGHQWNIGRITSAQLEHSLDDSYEYSSYDPAALGGSQDRRKTSAPQPEISIALESAGYAKFRGMPSRRGLEAAKLAAFGGGSLGGSQVSLPQPMITGDIGGGGSGAQPTQGFHRQVVMAYAKSWTSGLREKLSALGDENRRPASMHQRQTSATSAGSYESAHSPEQVGGGGSSADIGGKTVVTQPGQGLRPKGYMFTSPWDGLCQFHTGNGGRSLKLRHTLAGNTGGFNPLVAGGQSGSSSPQQGGGATTVSELRFNLPGAELFQMGKDEAVARKQELAGQFGRFVRGDKDSEDAYDATGLGREKAGGGNRGKRAKLGKLIVYGEGLKMLDLVVAANVGVWWGTWERTF